MFFILYEADPLIIANIYIRSVEITDRGGWVDELMSVSYTHLDVYKRQFSIHYFPFASKRTEFYSTFVQLFICFMIFILSSLSNSALFGGLLNDIRRKPVFKGNHFIAIYVVQ